MGDVSVFSEFRPCRFFSQDDSVGTSSGLMNANWRCTSVWKVSVVVLPVSQLVCVGEWALYDGLGLVRVG